MFERYSEKARRVIFFARYEASQFGSPHIETEHMLLALLREDRELMKRFRVLPGDGEEIRRQIEARTKLREKVSLSTDLPLSHQLKRVLAYAAEEAERMGRKQIDTQYHLLGLMREEKCLAAEILRERGLRLEQVREEIARTAPADTSLRPEPGLGARPFSIDWSVGWMGVLQDAVRTVALARREAARRNSACIETTDVLAALAIEKEFRDRFPEVAASLQARPKEPAGPRREVVSATELPFTEDCKQVFLVAAQEAARLGQLTGPMHLVLGILGVEACAAAEVLVECGLTAEGVRARLSPPPSDPEQGRFYV